MHCTVCMLRKRTLREGSAALRLAVAPFRAVRLVRLAYGRRCPSPRFPHKFLGRCVGFDKHLAAFVLVHFGDLQDKRSHVINPSHAE